MPVPMANAPSMNMKQPCAAHSANAWRKLLQNWRVPVAKTAKPLPSLEWLQPRLNISRAISLLSFFSLAALLLAWNLWFANVPSKLLWVILGVQLPRPRMGVLCGESVFYSGRSRGLRPKQSSLRLATDGPEPQPVLRRADVYPLAFSVRAQVGWGKLGSNAEPGCTQAQRFIASALPAEGFFQKGDGQLALSLQ